MAIDKDPTTPETLYSIWAKRNVHFETELEDGVIRQVADYGSGATSYNSAKGFSLGGGYEVYILAFFIGLYANKRRPLDGEKKTFGQPIQYWGNLEKRGERKPYSKLRDYMFAACVARTDIDLLALERDDITVSNVVSSMINTMDEYANYGLHQLLDKLDEDKHFFTNHTSFLSMFIPLFKVMNLTDDAESPGLPDSDEPESLD